MSLITPISTFTSAITLEKITTERPTDEIFKRIAQSIHLLNPGLHYIRHENNPVFVCKFHCAESIIGIVNLQQKAFAKGGFGKVYAVETNDPNVELVLKLSRKRLKIKNAGDLAKQELIGEFQTMRFIKENAPTTTGLNVHAFLQVFHNNQAGVFLKKYDFNGLGYLNTNPSIESKFDAMNDLYDGMTTLFDLNLVHRDIKVENILLKRNLKDVNLPEFETVLSDFGNTCSILDIFKQNPYPSMRLILGNGTRRNTSFHISCMVHKNLKSLKSYSIESEDYKKMVENINELMKFNDCFSMAILSYKLWTKTFPPFNTYKNEEFLNFEPGMNKEQKEARVNQLTNALYDACQPLSQSDEIVSFIIEGLVRGLDMR